MKYSMILSLIELNIVELVNHCIIKNPLECNTGKLNNDTSIVIANFSVTYLKNISVAVTP